jgi:hypothetical protein
MKKLLILFIILLTPALIFPHSGRTDKFGGHNNLKTGKYHYHNVKKSRQANNPYQPKYNISKEKEVFIGYPFKKVEIIGMKAYDSKLLDEDIKKYKLIISKKNNSYFWVTRNNQELKKKISGIFDIYYATDGSGYIKVARKSKEKLYIEHVHLGLDTITFFGFENK